MVNGIWYAGKWYMGNAECEMPNAKSFASDRPPVPLSPPSPPCTVCNNFRGSFDGRVDEWLRGCLDASMSNGAGAMC